MKLLRVSALCLFATACSDSSHPVDPPGRVLILGIDGASMERIEPLMAAGRLPNLKRIAEAGVHGPLRSLQPILSPRIWTTVATGVLPERHGVESWTKEEDEGVRLYNSHDRRVHALWNLASDAELTVSTVNWLMTFPAEPVNGVVISDLALPGTAKGRLGLWTGKRVEQEEREARADAIERLGPVTYPHDWRERIAPAMEAGVGTLAMTPDPFRGNEHVPKNARVLSRIAYERDVTLVRLAVEIDELLRPDVALVLLQGIDRVSHWMWGGFEDPEVYPEHLRLSPERAAAYREMLEAYYVYTDELIGVLLERYSANDLVLVLSDHGFEGGNSGYYRMTGTHDSEAALDGVLFGRGPGVEAGSTLEVGGAFVQDIAPTVLAWLGHPIAQDLDGAPASFLTPTRSLRKVGTYETKEISRLPFTTSSAEGEVLEELRKLGYIR